MHNSGVNASGRVTLIFKNNTHSSNSCAGSTFLEFDDVRVPADHLIGKENEGFQIIMSSKFIMKTSPSGSLLIVLPL
jgi:hypothetical protein